MKKFISLLLMWIISVTSFTSWASAHVVNSHNAINTSGINSHILDGDTNYQERWAKTWIIKRWMKAMARVLRAGWNRLEFLLRKAWADDTSQIIKVIENRHQIARALDSVADQFDYVWYTVKYTVYQQLQALGFSDDVAWIAAWLIDVLTF